MRVLESILNEKDEGQKKDVTHFINAILEKSSILNIIEQLEMYNSSAVVYQATHIGTQLLKILYEVADKDYMNKYQMKIVMKTTILLWNLYLIISCGTFEQQKVSANMIALIIANNSDCT